MHTKFRYWQRPIVCELQSWKIFYLTAIGVCAILWAASAYAVQHATRNFATASVVITKVEFPNTMTGRYVVANRQYDHREHVSPKAMTKVGSKLFVRYEVLRPENAYFTSYPAPWIEVVVTSFGLTLLVISVVFLCRVDGLDQTKT